MDTPLPLVTGILQNGSTSSHASTLWPDFIADQAVFSVNFRFRRDRMPMSDIENCSLSRQTKNKFQLNVQSCILGDFLSHFGDKMYNFP